MPSTIRFSKDHKLDVQEDPAAVQDLIAAAGPARVPIIMLTEPDDSQIRVNASRIVSIEDQTKPGRASF